MEQIALSGRGAKPREEWLTPPDLIKALGSFDLDPCSPIARPWPTARKHYTVLDNGLIQPWQGRVWLNPPYGDQAIRWLQRLAEHGDGVALIFARTDTAMFQDCIFRRADAILFKRGRIAFYDVKGRPAPANAGAPPCFVAFGASNVTALHSSGIEGTILACPKIPALEQPNLFSAPA